MLQKQDQAFADNFGRQAEGQPATVNGAGFGGKSNHYDNNLPY